MQRPRKFLLLLIPAACLLLLAAWLSFARERQAPEPLATEGRGSPAPVSQGSTSASGANPFWDLAEQASALAQRSEQSNPFRAIEQEEERWCAAARVATTPVEMQALAQKLPELLWPAMLGPLRARGDPSARAVADWLEASAEAQTRLRTEAASTQEPLVAVLALQQSSCKSDPACSRSLAARWAALDPGNLQAQLAAHTDEQDTDRWLDRLAASTHSRSHRVELMAQLQALPRPRSSGPVEFLMLEDWVGRSSAWFPAGYQQLSKACPAGAGPERRQRCSAVLERVWALAEDSVVDPLLATRLALRFPDPQPHWKERAALVKEAHVHFGGTARLQGFIDTHEKAERCKPLSPQDRSPFEFAFKPEWPQLRQALAASAP